MKLHLTCLQCGKPEDIEVARKDLLSWQCGELIQTAMPYLSDSQREMLISRICGKCFDEMFVD